MAVGDPIKIIALPVEGAPALTRYFPETDGATTRRMTLQQFKALLESTGMAFTAAITQTSTIRAGNLVTAAASPARILARQAGDSIEWGHVSTPNIASTLGAEKAAGRQYIALNGAAGTTVNDTYRAQGTKPSIIRSTLSGGFQFGTTTLATGDDQAFLPTVAIDSSGNITINNLSAVGITASGNISGVNITGTGPFTSPGIDDNATGERFQLADSIATFGTTGAGVGYFIARADNVGYLQIDAGNTGNAGANLFMVGGAHASAAFDYQFARAGVPVQVYDDSVGSHAFNTAGSVNLLTLHPTISVLPGDIRIGQNTSSAPGVGNATAGHCFINNAGAAIAYLSSTGQALAINNTSSGNMVGFYLAGVNQGFISGAGTTITYGAFMGSHIGQMYGKLVKGEELRRGDIVQTVDEMSEWIGFQFTDHNGNVVFNETDEMPADLKIGGTFEYTYERTVEKQITHVDEVEEIETVEVEEQSLGFEIHKGKAVAVGRSRMVKQSVYDEFPLVDKAGEPVMIEVPVLDAEGNPKLDTKPVLNRRGEPAFDRVIEKIGKKRHVTLVPRMEHVPVTELKQQIVRVPRKVKVKRERVETVQEVVTETVKATKVQLPNDTLVKWRLTDAAGCERPYGVIAWKDNDGSEDWLISGLGAYVVRIKKGVEVHGGDVIQSSDVRGAGEPITEEMNLSALQIVKRRVATVGANIPQPIYYGGPLHYPDGSYIVPATIHCG